MRQTLGGIHVAKRHNVTQVAGQRCSASAHSIRTAAATFSCTPSEGAVTSRHSLPIQEVAFAEHHAVLHAISSNNGNGRKQHTQQQQQLHLQAPCNLNNKQEHRQHSAQNSHEHEQPAQQLAPGHSSWNGAGSHAHHHLPQEQQQVNTQDATPRVQRQWSPMRSWQWLATQQQCLGPSSNLQTTVNIITQLSQRGVAPSKHDREQQQRFNSFLSQLLLSAQQQLQHQQVFAGGGGAAAETSVSPDDVTDLLWGLAKLGLQPQWHQDQKQHWPHRFPAAAAAAALVSQRAADVVAAAAEHLLQHLAHAHGGTFSARQLALCGWALAKLGYHTDTADCSDYFWQQYLGAVQRQVSAFNAQDLSNVIWALSHLQLQPSGIWLDSYFAAAQEALCSSSSSSASCSGQAVAVILLSLTQLQANPSSAWIDAVLLSLLQQRRPDACLLQHLGGHALGSVLGAVAKWGHVPQQRWMQVAVAAVEQQLQKCNGQDVAQISWALATITAAAADVTAHAIGSSSSWDSNEQEPGLVKLRKQMQQNRCGVPAPEDSRNPLQQQHDQHSPQQHFTAAQLGPEVLQQLVHRLAETARTTAPCQVVLGMWGVTKLHQMAQQGLGGYRSWQAADMSQPSTNGSHSSRPFAAWHDHQQQEWLQYQQATGEPAQLQRQHRLHWQPCRSALLHCVSVLEQQQGLQSLDCKHMAMLLWSLAVAGGSIDSSSTQQQTLAIQQLLQLHQRHQTSSSYTTHSRRSRIAGIGSGSSSSILSISQHLVQQVLASSRDGLVTGNLQSHAVLLRALVKLGVQPSWQWLLRFYEASEPQLDHSSAKDLSMMAGGLTQLRVRPLGSWLAKFLQATRVHAERQGLDVECLVTICAAVAGPSWGLTAAVGAGHGTEAQQQQGGQPIELLAPGWNEAMQQQVLLLLPQLSLVQVAALLRSAAALQWCQGDSSSGVVSGLLQRALHVMQPQSFGGVPEVEQQHVVQQLQVLAAATQLPGNVLDDWWLQAATHVSGALLTLQKQAAGSLCTEQLCAGMRIVSSATRRQRHHQQSHQELETCLQHLIAVSVHQVSESSLSESLQLLEAACRSLEWLDSRPTVAAGPDSQAAAGPDSQAGCQTALQQLRSAVQEACMQQIPHMGLAQLAAVLAAAGSCGLLTTSQQVGAVSPVLLASMSTIGQLLHSIEQQLQQPVHQQTDWPVRQQRLVQAAADTAGHLATILAALGRCSYRPSSKLLRHMLQHIQRGLPSLDAQRLAHAAAAAAALHPMRLLGPGFRGQFWQALSAVLRRPSKRSAVSLTAGGTSQRLRLQNIAVQQHSAVAAAEDRGYPGRVLLVVSALHDLTAPHVPCSGSVAAGRPHLACRTGRSCMCGAMPNRSLVRRSLGLGVPAPRLLVEQAFKASAAVWQDLGCASRDQQSRHQQQLRLLRMLVPLASRLSTSGLKCFTRVVGPQLKQLPRPQKQRAWALLRQLLLAWRAGKQHRLRLVLLARQRKALRKQQQHEVAMAVPVEVSEACIAVQRCEQQFAAIGH